MLSQYDLLTGSRESGEANNEDDQLENKVRFLIFLFEWIGCVSRAEVEARYCAFTQFRLPKIRTDTTVLTDLRNDT